MLGVDAGDEPCFLIRFISLYFELSDQPSGDFTPSVCASFLPQFNQSEAEAFDRPLFSVWSVPFHKVNAVCFCFSSLIHEEKVDARWGREGRRQRGSRAAAGELILPWSESRYSNKEPSRLPGIWDDSPRGDEEKHGGRERDRRRGNPDSDHAFIKSRGETERKWYDGDVWV